MESSDCSSKRTSPFRYEDDHLMGETFPPGKRLAPVGANDEDDKEVETGKLGRTQSLDLTSHGEVVEGCSCKREDSLRQKVKVLEQDQEELNSSLMSMTSHFAKVQLRLQQVIGAPAAERERLLMDLQRFAFRGIPDVKPATNGDDDQAVDVLEAQRKKHSKLIDRLKGQLEELEGYVYESGEGSMPSNVLLERQKVVMEQLKARLNMNVDNMDKLTEDQLKAEVDEAVVQLVAPLKMKSHLVNQLKTQIEDLEMFVEFLQGEASTMTPRGCDDCGCNGAEKEATTTKRTRFQSRTKSQQDEIRRQSQSILDKAMTVLRLTTMAQFGCGSEAFRSNTLKETSRGNHYGDLRAKLELSVGKVVECIASNSTASASDGQTEVWVTSPKVAWLVRKELAVAIRDLMHHGLVSEDGGSSIVAFMGCVSARSGGVKSISHAWDVVLKFYEMKLGHEYNASPARKLSQSFGLDLTGSSSSSTKQTFLATVFHIISTHSPYKRSADAKFKAFICAGLNRRKLISWLKLIVRNQTILEQFYAPSSFVAKTGFDDAFETIERLSTYKFRLPEDVAVKQFHRMEEAF